MSGIQITKKTVYKEGKERGEGRNQPDVII
jgi:hypothetical protein